MLAELCCGSKWQRNELVTDRADDGLQPLRAHALKFKHFYQRKSQRGDVQGWWLGKRKVSSGAAQGLLRALHH
ncbi:hypothetical protein E2C01_092330 [Portunus trituberculatus]|uniref:Uncharacterized protein n=1 Tax=Portunus trituberculatus TaxID=210409 RepID=A0A5B7JLH1_PORTR|nr:hypothetical protein [Portunus trituberculatus]